MLTKRLVALVAFLAMATGCATVGTGPAPQKPGLSEAVALVWNFYGRTDPPPKVRVLEGAALSCTDPNSGAEGFPVILGAEDGAPRVDCREGYTVLPTEVMVAWTGKKPWSQTAMAHELMHARQFREGIIDPKHERPEWQEVARANAKLEAAGL